jgi:hypothetical protein
MTSVFNWVMNSPSTWIEWDCRWAGICGCESLLLSLSSLVETVSSLSSPRGLGTNGVEVSFPVIDGTSALGGLGIDGGEATLVPLSSWIICLSCAAVRGTGGGESGVGESDSESSKFSSGASNLNPAQIVPPAIPVTLMSDTPPAVASAAPSL